MFVVHLIDQQQEGHEIFLELLSRCIAKDGEPEIDEYVRELQNKHIIQYARERESDWGGLVCKFNSIS